MEEEDGFVQFKLCCLCGLDIEDDGDNRIYKIKNNEDFYIDVCEGCQAFAEKNLNISDCYSFTAKKGKKWEKISFELFSKLCGIEDRKDLDRKDRKYSKITYHKNNIPHEYIYEVGNVSLKDLVSELDMVPNKKFIEKIGCGLEKTKKNLNFELKKIKKKRKMLELLK